MTTEPPPNYRHHFWRSSHHLWLGVLTLGLGFASGSGLGLIVGCALFAIGHVFWPDTKWFRKTIDEPREAALRAAEQARHAAFEEQRAQLLDSLSRDRRARYQSLATVCREITSASAESSPSNDLALSLETRLRKLDELLWTYLRLLTISQSLEVYLETERREKLTETAELAQDEFSLLEAELQGADPKDPALETRRKLLASRRDRLFALQQRLSRVAQANANLELACSEQERLVEQAKLIRADALAHKNAEALGARIDISIEHLTETNRWLSELSSFTDLTNQLPQVTAGSMLVPPIPSRPGHQTQVEKV